jgi:uncharacterized OsmC-like protein
MKSSTETTQLTNGVDTQQVISLAGKIQENDDYGKFRFRASNHWVDGSRSRSCIQNFFAGGEENSSHKKALTVDANQPDFLGGGNTAPNPVEHLLHALDSCLTTTLVYHASVQGIKLESVDTQSEGEMNARGFFGISDEVNKGYERIRVNMRVKSDASVDILTKLAMYSPVYEMISRSVPVEFTMTKI